MSRRKIKKPLSKMKQLTFNEMLNLKGGVCVEEYCATVSMLIENNWGNWDDHQREAAANAYATHC